MIYSDIATVSVGNAFFICRCRFACSFLLKNCIEIRGLEYLKCNVQQVCMRKSVLIICAFMLVFLKHSIFIKKCLENVSGDVILFLFSVVCDFCFQAEKHVILEKFIVKTRWDIEFLKGKFVHAELIAIAIVAFSTFQYTF